jgi:hypothetical protein
MYNNKKNECFVPKNQFKQLSSRVNKIESSIGMLSNSVMLQKKFSFKHYIIKIQIFHFEISLNVSLLNLTFKFNESK